MTNKGYISKYGNGDIPLTVFEALDQVHEHDIKIVKNGEVIAEGTRDGWDGLSPSIMQFGNHCVKKISHKYSGVYFEIGEDVRLNNL